MIINESRTVPRTLPLSIAVSEVSLTAGLNAGCAMGPFVPPTLLFSGAVQPPSADSCPDAWDLPGFLGGRLIDVRCAAAKLQSRQGPGESAVGSCQFSPVAPDIGITAEVFCCQKLFGALKNVVNFGGGGSGNGLLLLMDLSHDNDDLYTQGRAIMRLPVTRIMIRSVRSFGQNAPEQQTRGLRP
jgi:hypothetical protein